MWCLNYSKSNYFSFLLISLVVSCNSKEPDKVYDHCFRPERSDTIAYNPPESESKEGLAWHNIPSSNNPVEEERSFINKLKSKWQSEQSTSGIDIPKIEQRQIPEYTPPKDLPKYTPSSAEIEIYYRTRINEKLNLPPIPTPPPTFSGQYERPYVPDHVTPSTILGSSNTNPSIVEVDGHFKSNGIYVEPHIRTSANNTTIDNFSTAPNINPVTGKIGTRKY